MTPGDLLLSITIFLLFLTVGGAIVDRMFPDDTP